MHVSFNVRSYLNNYFVSLFIRHTHHHTLFHQINQTDSKRTRLKTGLLAYCRTGEQERRVQNHCNVPFYIIALLALFPQLFQAFEKITTCGNKCKEVWTAGRRTV